MESKLKNLKTQGPSVHTKPADANQQTATDKVSEEHGAETTLDDLAEYLRLVSEKTFDEEMARKQSMLDTSSRLLACASIISVALVSVLPIMLGQLTDGKKSSATLILILSFIALGFIIASLGVGVVAQYRFEYSALDTPRKLEEDIRNSAPKLKTKYQIVWQYSNTLDKVQTTVASTNDKLGRLNKLALVLLGIALGMVMLTCVVFLMLLFV